MKNRFYTILMFAVFFHATVSHAQYGRSITIPWNQTNKDLPPSVKDSINSFFSKFNFQQVAFRITGTGFSKDKNDISGIYYFKPFMSHVPIYALIIYNNDIYINNCIDTEGILAETCSILRRNVPCENFGYYVFNSLYDFFIDEYQYIYIQNQQYEFFHFANLDEKIRFIINKSNINKIKTIYNLMPDLKTILMELPTYMVTKYMSEEECIILLGLICGIKYDSV